MEFIINLGVLLQARRDFFLKLIVEYIVLSLTAIIIITVVGITTGILISKSKKAARIVIGITNILYTIPSIAMFGFFVSITGIGNTTAIIALVSYGLLPVIRNTYVGLIEVDDQILEAAVGMGSNTFSDLAAQSSNLVLGSEYDFYEREDGYPGLVKTYGFNFKETREMDIGLKYKAIGAGEVDVINNFSTDGLLAEYDLKVLQDDKKFFPAYQAATVIRQETLNKYPELEGILNKLANQITDKEMQQMNYYVEKENRDAKDVANDFLKAKGLLQ